jgi:hypothetical protein
MTARSSRTLIAILACGSAVAAPVSAAGAPNAGFVARAEAGPTPSGDPTTFPVPGSLTPGALPETAPLPPPSSGVGSIIALFAPTGERQVCVHDTWVRASDLSHVKGILYYGDWMDVDRYTTSTNSKTGNTTAWAVGTAHTRQGDVYGYVLYNSHTFRTGGKCV